MVEVPVFVINGFLESGKTSLIKDVLPLSRNPFITNTGTSTINIHLNYFNNKALISFFDKLAPITHNLPVAIGLVGLISY